MDPRDEKGREKPGFTGIGSKCSMNERWGQRVYSLQLGILSANVSRPPLVTRRIRIGFHRRKKTECAIDVAFEIAICTDAWSILHSSRWWRRPLLFFYFYYHYYYYFRYPHRRGDNRSEQRHFRLRIFPGYGCLPLVYQTIIFLSHPFEHLDPLSQAPHTPMRVRSLGRNFRDFIRLNNSTDSSFFFSFGKNRPVKASTNHPTNQRFFSVWGILKIKANPEQRIENKSSITSHFLMPKTLSWFRWHH